MTKIRPPMSCCIGPAVSYSTWDVFLLVIHPLLFHTGFFPLYTIWAILRVSLNLSVISVGESLYLTRISTFYWGRTVFFISTIIIDSSAGFVTWSIPFGPGDFAAIHLTHVRLYWAKGWKWRVNFFGSRESKLSLHLVLCSSVDGGWGGVGAAFRTELEIAWGDQLFRRNSPRWSHNISNLFRYRNNNY